MALQVIQFITAFAALVAAIVSAVNVVVSFKNNAALHVVRAQTDGLMRKFGAEQFSDGHAEGLEQGRHEGKGEELKTVDNLP